MLEHGFKYLYGVLNMKKVLLVLLALIMVLSMVTTAVAVPGNGMPPGQAKQMYRYGIFDDIDGVADWAGADIETMAEAGIIKGNGNGQFFPGHNVKEIEVIAMLLRVIGAEDDLDLDEALTSEFEGEEPSPWMIPYINMAIEQEIVAPEDIKSFYPNSVASREEVAGYVWSILQHFDLETKVEVLEDYDDEAEINVKYQNSVRMMKKYGLMIGYQNKFQPNKPMSRVECAVLMNRIFSNFNIEDFDWLNIDTDYDDTDIIKGILYDIDTSNTTLEAITIDVNSDGDDDDNVDKEFEYFDEGLEEVMIANNYCDDADEDISIEDFIEFKNKYEKLEVEVEFEVVDEENVVTKLIIYYNELEGVLENPDQGDEDGANIIPSEKHEDDYGDESVYFTFDKDVVICKDGDVIDEEAFDNLTNNFVYTVNARLLGNGKLIELCIESEENDEEEFEGKLKDYEVSTTSEGDVLTRIKVKLDDDSRWFDVDSDYSIDPDDFDDYSLIELLDENIDDTIKIETNSSNEVIDIELFNEPN